MKQIVDEYGNKINNHYRLGNIIYVKDEKAKNAYNINVNNINKIKNLENELSEIKNIMNKLLEKNNI